MPHLKDIFQDPIDRPIKGVIKADEDAQAELLTEAEEYVLTREVAKRLQEFLDAYNSPQATTNGAWISGFFGSGKSHLLKMLSLLLADRTLNGRSVLDLFRGKIDDRVLTAELEKAVRRPSESILFNIDQKAPVTHKNQADALLSVFVKVFDEMNGYDTTAPHVAQFERDLDQRGQYAAFQAEFEKVSGEPWTSGREVVVLESDSVDRAYARVSGKPLDSVRGIIDKYRDDYELSIEAFAEQVNDYIQAQGDKFRLNFFVDEVGQYIADNVKLMTNLQTVAESLATKCHGRAWIVVTAQEDMNTVMGEAGRQQSNDFSKIQDRFAVRLKLTSADVEEVIRRRLLTKNEAGRRQLADIYDEQRNNFKTLFEFGDGAQTYRNFRDREHFIAGYPFVPYQFVLFQKAIEQLSIYNAFEGKHSSVGERSMLSVFQKVAVQMANADVGALATFDHMFAGIRQSLKSQQITSIRTAEQSLQDDNDALALRLLKALFLVKYVKEFKATVRNLTILMYDRFDTDVGALRRDVETALNMLERQTYIQRNGAEYEYLTNEEQDVEQEIKNIDLDADAVVDKLSDIFFDRVLRDRKYRHDTYKYDYAFARHVDGRRVGHPQEIGVHLVSPYDERENRVAQITGRSMDDGHLYVVLPPERELMREIALYLRTEKYIRQHAHNKSKESLTRIVNGKREQNDKRLQELQTAVSDAVLAADMIVNGKRLEITSTDARTRLLKGIDELIKTYYRNLHMLRGHAYTGDEVGPTIRESGPQLLPTADAGLSEAEREMRRYVMQNKQRHLHTTIKMVRDHFRNRPYGWPSAAVQFVLAKLISRNQVELRRRSDLLLQTEEQIAAVQNTAAHDEIYVSPEEQIPRRQIHELRDFYGDFFAEPAPQQDPKLLGRATAERFNTLAREIDAMRDRIRAYPFSAALDDFYEAVQAVSGKAYDFYLRDLSARHDDLLDGREQVWAPLQTFMNGPQRETYDEARRFLDEEDGNLTYLEEGAAAELRTLVNRADVYRGPHLRRIREQLDGLRTRLDEKRTAVRADQAALLDREQERLTETAQFAQLTAAQQQHIRAAFDRRRTANDRLTDIALIRDQTRRFIENEARRALPDQIRDWTTPPPPPPPTPDPGAGTDGDPAPADPAPLPSRTPTVRLSRLLPGHTLQLTTTAEVDEYVEKLRRALHEQIENGRHIDL